MARAASPSGTPSRKKQRLSSGLHLREAPPPENRVEFAQSLGAPPGIAREMVHACEAFPLRIFVIDNSGSMNTFDGHRLVADAAGRAKMCPCSRWDELLDSLAW